MQAEVADRRDKRGVGKDATRSRPLVVLDKATGKVGVAVQNRTAGMQGKVSVEVMRASIHTLEVTAKDKPAVAGEDVVQPDEDKAIMESG